MKIFVKGGQWSNSEDQLMLAFVQNHGLNSWGSIAASITRKTAEQCKQRWEEFLDPNINKGDWSIEEKQLLLEIYEVFPDQWTTIATYLERRRPWQCQEQFEKMRGGSGAGGVEDENAQEDSGAVSSAASGLKVFHEMREARKDRVDGDEYEEHMMELGRARLANQAGRKDYRKEQKKEEEQTRAITALQRKNEMVSAGVATVAQERKFARALQDDKKFLSGEKRNRDDNDDEEDESTTFKPVKMSEVLGSKTTGTAVRAAVEKGRRDLVADHVVTQREAWKNNSLLPDFDLGAAPTQQKLLVGKGQGATPAIAAPHQQQISAEDDFVANLLGGFDEVSSGVAAGAASTVVPTSSASAVVAAEEEEEEDMFADLPAPAVDFSDLPEPQVVGENEAPITEAVEEGASVSTVSGMSKYESRITAERMLKMARTSRWKLLEMEYGVPRAEVLNSIRSARTLMREEVCRMGPDDCLDHRLISSIADSSSIPQDVLIRARLDELAAVGEKWDEVSANSMESAVQVPTGVYAGLLGQKSEMRSEELVLAWNTLRQELVYERNTVADITARITHVDGLIAHEEKQQLLQKLHSEPKGTNTFADILQLLVE